MVSYSNQLVLLTIDPDTGRFYPIPDKILYLTLAGAVLFDASFGGYINDDYQQITVVKKPASDKTALTDALRCLQAFSHPVPIHHAISLIATRGPVLIRMILSQMQADGFLLQKNRALMSINDPDAVYSSDLQQVIGIHLKVRHVVIEEVIPDYQIPALVSLLVAGGTVDKVFKPNEIETFKEKIQWLAGMESLGREIIQSIGLLEAADLEVVTSRSLGLPVSGPKSFAGGIDSVLSSLSFLIRETGVQKSRKILARLNQEGGVECSGCAWPNPQNHRSPFEFCESGAKIMSSEATRKRINAEFFEKWSIHDLRKAGDYWMEQQGRLTIPMYLDENETNYRPVSWESAFRIIADELNQLQNPDEAIFYASGKTSMEAAFLLQLFARSFGTNNLASSANLCHEPSGEALTISLGSGKGSVTLDDFSCAEAIFIFGHNPGSNHPRMLKSLQEAARNKCAIVSINPMIEASLLGFSNPQEASAYISKPTKLSTLYLQPRINGDMALVRGIAKAVLEFEEESGGIIDQVFLDKCTMGYSAYVSLVKKTSWNELIEASGIEKTKILEAARIYSQSHRTIASWCLGITHHINAAETIQEIINLMLLKGNIGKPGAGILPVRGHSNIQGIRTVGFGEKMPEGFLNALGKYFSFEPPRSTGLSTIPAIQALSKGKASILMSLGGNLAAALPDTQYVSKALSNCRLTVQISTKLNRSHVITGKKALILPCLTRSEVDHKGDSIQIYSIEDAMGRINFSRGCLKPASKSLMSETEIISAIAFHTCRQNSNISWAEMGRDNHLIRQAISAIVPSLKLLEINSRRMEGFFPNNSLKNRLFITPDQKARFQANPLSYAQATSGELLLMTIRSHDQFNTSIFGLDDRYRGIVNERKVLFMNHLDMAERDILPEQQVSITSSNEMECRKINGYYAIPHPISKGCVAAYFPEINEIFFIHHVNSCKTPAYKSISVQVKAYSFVTF